MPPKKGAASGKAAAKAAKKEKQAQKAAKKEAAAIKASTKGGKGKGKETSAADDDEDLDAILDRYKAEMEAVSFNPCILLSLVDEDMDLRAPFSACCEYRDDAREPAAAAHRCAVPALAVDAVVREQPPVLDVWGVL